MKGRIKPKLTYANVMVTVLAFIVLGGVAVAAGVQALKKNSVGTKQLKNGAVTTAKIKNGAVDGSRLNPSALNGYAKASDLSGFLKAPVGPDQLATTPAAGLSGPIYNVGGQRPSTARARTATNSPTTKLDDIDFSKRSSSTPAASRTPSPARRPIATTGSRSRGPGPTWSPRGSPGKPTRTATGKSDSSSMLSSESVLPDPCGRASRKPTRKATTSQTVSAIARLDAGHLRQRRRAARTRAARSSSPAAACRSPGSEIEPRRRRARRAGRRVRMHRRADRRRGLGPLGDPRLPHAGDRALGERRPDGGRPHRRLRARPGALLVLLSAALPLARRQTAQRRPRGAGRARAPRRSGGRDHPEHRPPAPRRRLARTWSRCTARSRPPPARAAWPPSRSTRSTALFDEEGVARCTTCRARSNRTSSSSASCCRRARWRWPSIWPSAPT